MRASLLFLIFYIPLLAKNEGCSRQKQASNPEQEMVSQAILGCSDWVMADLSFKETMYRLREDAVSPNLIRILFEVKGETLLPKTTLSEEDIYYVTKVTEGFLNDVRDILFIKRPISVLVERKGLNATADCKRNTLNLSLDMLQRLFILAFNRAVEMNANLESSFKKKDEIRGLEFHEYTLLWSDTWIDSVAQFEVSHQKEVATLYNRISYFTFSELYKFMLFVVAHETYHLMTNCEKGLENEADLLGVIVYQYLFRYINFDKDDVWNCVFDNSLSSDNVTLEELVEFLYGREIYNIFETLYTKTSYKSDSAHLPLERRKKYIEHQIENVHINDLYQRYERPIEQFNRSM